MTWTGKFTVDAVEESPTVLVASADAEAIISNTEGKIRRAGLRLELDEDQTSVKVGDVLSVSGHFTG